MTNENFSKSLSPRRPRAPERPTPRALATPKSLSSADVDRCARFAGRKKVVVVRFFFSRFSSNKERLFVFARGGGTIIMNDSTARAPFISRVYKVVKSVKNE